MNKPKLKVIELFSGIGAQKRGIDMTNLFNCEVIATSDIDKYATLSYAAVHCGLTPESLNKMDFPSPEEMAKVLKERNIGYDFKKDKPCDWDKVAHKKNQNEIKKYYAATIISNNLGDISRIDSLPQADFWTYSFPCQDISVAGLQKGISKGETRSGLLYEVERLIVDARENDTLPQYLLLENVKNLVGSKFKDQFDSWRNRLNEFGFNTYWKVLNGKNCGIPQNRERVFAVSIRKDIDTKRFEFPEPFDNGARLVDILETEVDEKYYISEEHARKFLSEYSDINAIIYDEDTRNVKEEGQAREYSSYYRSLVARDYKAPCLVNDSAIKRITTDLTYNHPRPRGYANCLLSGDRGITNQKSTGNGVIELDRTNTVRQIGNIVDTGNWNNPQRGRIYDPLGCCPTVNTMQGGGLEPKILENNIRIRKLTPTESWRLMGFCDEDVEKARAMGVSNSQLYKQAGNSIITNCIMLLMEHLYEAQYDEDYICYDELFSNNQHEDPDSDNNFNRCIKLGHVGKGRQGDSVYDSEGLAITQTVATGGQFRTTGGYLIRGK